VCARVANTSRRGQRAGPGLSSPPLEVVAGHNLEGVIDELLRIGPYRAAPCAREA
jgi:hypothetical protein